MAVALAETPILNFLNNAGCPNVGGSILTQVGGINFPTYEDANGTTPLPNPIPLNSRGEVSNSSGVSCQLYLSPGIVYTFTLFDAHGNQIWVAEDVIGIAPVTVGNMTDEKGSGGQPGFVNGTDFTDGTTTSLTLSQAYGSSSNLWVAFDGTEQGADTYTLAGLVLTFNAPIPIGTNKVYVKGGTALTVGTPATGTIIDASVASGTKLYNRLINFVFANDPQFGAKGDGVTDNSAALTAALAYCVASGRTLLVPAGTYVCKTQILVAGAVTMIGEGVANTIFTFPTNGGFQFTIPDQYHSVHLRDFSVLAGAVGAGNAGIKLISAETSIPNPANSQLSDLTNININGSDGAGNLNYWTAAFEIEYVSNINFINVNIVGTNTQNGTGVFVHGSAALVPVVFNFTASTFNFLSVGVTYGDYVQGIFLTQCEFTGCQYGVNSASGEHTLVQLGVSNSQFNCFVSGINANTAISDLTVNGTTFYVPGPTTGTAQAINLVSALRYSISGNSISGYGTISNSIGVVIGTSLGKGVVGNNCFEGLTTGVFLQSGSSGDLVDSNTFNSVTTPIVDLGTGNISSGNMGIPTAQVGVSLPATGVYQTNTFGRTCTVYVGGGTVTTIAINAIVTGITSGAFKLNVGDQIAVFYTVAPVYTWIAQQ